MSVWGLGATITYRRLLGLGSGQRELAAGASNRPPRGPREKARVYEGVEDETAVVGAQMPEPYGLGQREFHARHLGEVRAHSIDDSGEAHTSAKSNRRATCGRPPETSRWADSRVFFKRRVAGQE